MSKRRKRFGKDKEDEKPPEPYNHKNCKKFATFPKHATPIDCLNDLCSKECFIPKDEPREG